MWFGFIASIKPCLKTSMQQPTLQEGNHIQWIRANLLTVCPFCYSGTFVLCTQWQPVLKISSLEIILDQAFEDNVRTGLPW